MYERMGFSLQTRYRILEAQGLDAGGGAGPGEVGSLANASSPAIESSAAMRVYASADLDEVLALDRAATGEDRGHVIRRFASPATTRVLDGRGEVRGFVIRAPWGGGATVARDAADAMHILHARRRASGTRGRVRVGLVEENAAGLAALEAAGLRPIWSAPRLIRGEPLEWRPEWIWGQFNHAIG